MRHAPWLFFVVVVPELRPAMTGCDASLAPQGFCQRTSEPRAPDRVHSRFELSAKVFRQQLVGAGEEFGKVFLARAHLERIPWGGDDP